MQVPEINAIIFYIILSNITVLCLRGDCGDNRCCANFRFKNGRCEECPAGTYGINCWLKCPDGYYGRLCTRQCYCANFRCSRVTGCDCGPPPYLPFASTTYNTTVYGSYAYITCNKSNTYTLVYKALCNSDGKWNIPQYICSEDSDILENENMIYLIGVTVSLVFIVVIISMAMIFRNRYKSISKRYRGIAYESGASKSAVNVMYSDLKEYHEIGNVPEQSPAT